jgi:hypothetical protein
MAAVSVFCPATGFGQVVGDDLFLLQTSVSPNVVLMLDNSGSMDHIEWHEAFDSQAGTYGCSAFDNTLNYDAASFANTETYCSNTRSIFKPDPDTRYDGRYLNWYFSDAADPYYTAIQTAVTPVAGCAQAGRRVRLREQVPANSARRSEGGPPRPALCC